MGATQFSAETLKTQNLLAVIAQLSAENAALKAEILTDSLTRIANRRAFDRTLKREYARCQREHLSMSCLLLDLDHFKQFNDTYGHPAGDRLLHRIAQRWQAIPQRPGDLVARYGGEEFGMVLPTTHEAGAMQIAKTTIEATRTIKAERQITVSIGAVTVNDAANLSLHQFIALADQALYRAKQQGRDRICCAVGDLDIAV